MDSNTSQPANQEAVKELWLECAKGAQSRGNLEKLPTRKARTPREVETARKQNAALSRKVFMMPNTDWHDRIFGGNDAA